MLLLHDEQSEIRDPVCRFAAALDNDGEMMIPQHYYATEVKVTLVKKFFSHKSKTAQNMFFCHWNSYNLNDVKYYNICLFLENFEIFFYKLSIITFVGFVVKTLYNCQYSSSQ